MARAKRYSENAYIEPLATRLRELTEETGVSQTELAAAIGVTRQAVNSYTLGNTVPNSDVLINIARYFNVSTDYLLGISDVKSVNVTLKEICEMTGLSEKSITILQNILKLQKKSYINMLNFLIEETDFVLQDFGGYRFYNSTLRSMYEYFFFKMKNKEFIVSSNGAMIEVTDKNDEDVAFVLSETEAFGEVDFADEEYYDEIEIRKVNSADLFESFKFQNLTEQIKESKAKYMEQKGEQDGNHRKEE